MVRDRLGLPLDMPAEEQLGRLSEKYRFSMQQARQNLPGRRTTHWAGDCRVIRPNMEPTMSTATRSDPTGCACAGAPKLIFACSGAADVGAVADLAGRKLTKEGAGKMYCLAGIGGRVSGIIETTKAAGKVLAIDGCPIDCAKRTLLEAGLTRFEHVQLAALGMAKGQSPVTEERVNAVAAAGRQVLGT